MGKAIAKCEARLQDRPWVFLFVSRFSPYLKSVGSFSAGVVGVEPRIFFVRNLFCAAADGTWFLGIGFFISASAEHIAEVPVFARVIGVLVVALIALLFFKKKTAPTLAAIENGRLRASKRGIGFHLKVALRLPFWEARGRLTKWFGAYERPVLRFAIRRAVEEAIPGDIILVGRAQGAPWSALPHGWSHGGVVVPTPAGKAIAHAYQKSVTVCMPENYPMPFKVAVLRVKCTQAVREAAIAALWGQLGKPFRVTSRSSGKGIPRSFSCITLISWAYGEAGFSLIEAPVGSTIVPDDLIIAGRCAIVHEFGGAVANGGGRVIVDHPKPFGCKSYSSCSQQGARSHSTPPAYF